MSRYQIQKYVDCDYKEFIDTINYYKKRGYTIEKRESATGNFIVATMYNEDTYIAHEENEKEYNIKQCRLWHEKLPKEECKECDRMECENKKEVNQA